MGENCNLPDTCDCELCEYWGENSSDLSRTPDWQQRREEEDE